METIIINSMIDDGSIAVKYRKVKLFENIYVFAFDDFIENIQSYNMNDDTITYLEDGKSVELFEMTDPDFIISDEEYCYSDLSTTEFLKSIYEEDNYEVVKEKYKDDCQSFFRICAIDEDAKDVKVISTQKEKILSLKSDTNNFSMYMSDINSYGDNITLTTSSIDLLIENLKANDSKKALANLSCLKAIYEGIKEQIENVSEITIDLKATKEIDDIEKELNNLIGLEDVKKFVLKLKHFLEYLNKVEGKLNLEQPNLNMIFKGNPGTGKTTIARIIANTLFALNYVKTPNFKEITAQDLIAGYVGQTAIKTRELIDEVGGGVIFLDEAYVLAADGQEFAQEALVEILKEMENKENIFIFAGYKNEMEKFVDMNPGIKSRVGNFIEFNDYSKEELYKIFESKLKKAQLKITKGAKQKILNVIEDNMCEEKFGNGRFVDRLYDKMLIEHANRCYTSNGLMVLRTITSEDIKDMNELKEKRKVKIGY